MIDPDNPTTVQIVVFSLALALLYKAKRIFNEPTQPPQDNYGADPSNGSFWWFDGYYNGDPTDE